MKKVLCVAILSAFTVALVAETALFALGKTTDVGSLIELGVAWGVVLVAFIAGVLRIAFGRSGGVGVVVIHHYDEPEEDEPEDGEDDEPEDEDHDTPTNE